MVVEREKKKEMLEVDWGGNSLLGFSHWSGAAFDVPIIRALIGEIIRSDQSGGK